jgi:hypothetical protein
VRGTKTKKAEGENSNTLIYKSGMPVYKRSSKTELPALNLKDSYVIDFQTVAGHEYVIEAITPSNTKL